MARFLRLALICACLFWIPRSAVGQPTVASQRSGNDEVALSIRDAKIHGLECFRIQTRTATYLLDKRGAGLASMIDQDGNDWLSFNPKAGTGAAGEYRGFPNAVYKEAGSYFHALNAATDPCVTKVQEANEAQIVLSAESENGVWAAEYVFTHDGCTFTLTRKPAGHDYWVLYEGTPGGAFDDTDWWMSAESQTKHSMKDQHAGDLVGTDGIEWIAFGDEDSPRMLVLTHFPDDDHPDHFYPMQQKMTVFGFGRAGMAKFLDTVPQSFSIGFVESTAHSQAKAFARQFNKPPHVARSVDAFPSLTRLAQRALTSVGDPLAGKVLFKDQRTKCDVCHRVGDQGGMVGPNLTNVGGKLDRPHLVDSLLHPSRQIGYGFETTIVVDADGKTYSGIAQESNDQHLILLDADSKRITIARTEIELSKVADTSLMPSGIADALTDQEFVDLVAYLESLGRKRGKFGSGVSGPIQLAEGFQLTTIATGLSGAVAMEVTPDGRILVCEQGGTLRVIEDQSNASLANEPRYKLLPAPMLELPAEMNWERGLIGVTVAPAFPEDPFVYVVYVASEPYTHHRISRFRVEGNTALAGSEKILLRGDDQSKFGGKVPAGHQGGGIHFGADGKLYVGIGEQTAGKPAQQMHALQGKILRLNRDGSIPQDNPFLEETTGKYQAIWAKGCRNPFTFAFSRSGAMFINDVGGKFEEINRGVAGANYGWPNADHGKTDKPEFTSPIHAYPQSCINGGDFCNSEDWPQSFQGKYFFADFNQGWIKTIDPDAPDDSQLFLSGIRRPVDLRFGPNGDLFVLLRNAWVVDDKFEGGTSAVLRISRTR